jgi:hypothetical protein
MSLSAKPRKIIKQDGRTLSFDHEVALAHDVLVEDLERKRHV